MSNQELDKVVNQLKLVLKAIDDKEDEEKVSEYLKVFAELGFLGQLVLTFESKIAELLRKQRRFYQNYLTGWTSTEVVTDKFRTIFGWLNKNVFTKDPFAADMRDLTQDMTNRAIMEAVSIYMNELDEDVPFDGRLSKSMDKWINQHAKTVANFVNLNSQNTLKKVIKKGLTGKLTMQEVIQQLEHLPTFDRARARRVAVTELLAACSASQHEAYLQSPSVVGKRWVHTSTKNVREKHKDYSGTEVGLNEKFTINGHECNFPRDTSLPAGERVNCKCKSEPVIDYSIKDDLSKVAKEQLREKRIRKGFK